MTGFHTATNRAEPLSVASLERSAALFTMHCRFMAYAGMMAGYRAWAAVGRTSRRLRATVGAMLGVLAGRAKLAPVFCFVAGHAEGYPVVYVKHQFGVLRNGLDMMGVQIAMSAATLASVTVSLINECSPFRQITLGRSPLSSQGCSTLPCCGVFSGLVSSRAGSRTVDSRFVTRRKRHAALRALTRRCWIASCPARLRAILSRVFAIRLDKKLGTADSADFDDLCVLHGCIIPHNTQNEKHYVATILERWATMTGKTPVLLSDS
jgi:hypothetical protein